jgi:hypothetical protein
MGSKEQRAGNWELGAGSREGGVELFLVEKQIKTNHEETTNGEV